MSRRQDWPERLNAYIDSVRSRAFAWGNLDCCTLAANCVHVMTDRDPLDAIRGWTDQASAVRAIVAYAGSASIERAAERMADENRWPEVGRFYAQRGDLILVTETTLQGFDRACAICIGPVAMGIGPDGLISIPAARWMRAWRVS